MLNAIVSFSLRFRGVVLALALAFLGYGIYALTQAKYDVFPEFAPPVVGIQAEAPGLSAEQVELLVTQPLENAINGVTGIESLRSNSIQGLSVIHVIFGAGSEIYLDRQLVNERLASIAGQFPAGVHAPVMEPLTLATGTVLVVGLTSNKQSLMDLRTVADWTILPRLLAVPGVAKVSVFGGQVKQMQVQFLPEKLVQYGLALSDVIAAAQKATAVIGAGFVENDNQRLILQTQGQGLTPAQIASTVLVRQSGANVTLGDVAQVKEGAAPPFGAASVEGKTGVVLSIDGQYGSNTADVAVEVERALNELNPALKAQGIVMRPDLFRPAHFIDVSVHNVREGIYIPLGKLASVYQRSGRYNVLHDGARRVQTITLNVTGSQADTFTQRAQAEIAAKVHLAPGDYVQFTGTAAAEAQSRRDLLVYSALAALGVVLLLSVVLMNWRNLLLVLVNMPFALVGGVLAVFAGGGQLSLGAMVGFVTLFGITLRNSIMLISHYEHLVAVEGMTWNYETAIHGAAERLSPILMTALVTALGLLPLAIGTGAAGQEIEGPLAIVILGGLVTSTALNLLVLPTLALRFGRFEDKTSTTVAA